MRRFLFVLGIFCIVGLAAFAFLSPQGIKALLRVTGGINQVAASLHPPEEALGNFCGAIHAKQYQHAYDYYSHQLQQNTSLQAFIDLWSAHERQFYVLSCEPGTPQTHGNQSKIPVIFSEFYKGWQVTSDVTLFQENGAEWKIENIAPLPTDPPDVVVDTFCGGLTFDDYAQAYATYSPALQKRVSLAQFQRQWSGNGASYYHIDSCSHAPASIREKRATATVIVHEFYSNQQTTYRIVLVQDQTGWYITSVQ